MLLECKSCGTTVKAGCNCGVAYVPASVRAAKAVAANPHLSDRSIAKNAGVDHKTVAAARKSTGENSPVGKRTGQDGKSRALPAAALAAATARLYPVKSKPVPTAAENRKILAEHKARHIASSAIDLQKFTRACNTYLYRLTKPDMIRAAAHFAKCRKQNKDRKGSA